MLKRLRFKNTTLEELLDEAQRLRGEAEGTASGTVRERRDPPLPKEGGRA
jgi:hypothetical protein